MPVAAEAGVALFAGGYAAGNLGNIGYQSFVEDKQWEHIDFDRSHNMGMQFGLAATSLGIAFEAGLTIEAAKNFGNGVMNFGRGVALETAIATRTLFEVGKSKGWQVGAEATIAAYAHGIRTTGTLIADVSAGNALGMASFGTAALSTKNLLKGGRELLNSGEYIRNLEFSLGGFTHNAGLKWSDDIGWVNVPNSTRSLSDIKSHIRNHWELSPNSQWAHVIRGDVDEFNKLIGGLHTQKGLDDFIKLQASEGKNLNVTNVTSFAQKNSTEDEIFVQVLENGVKRIQLPREVWKNSTAFGKSVIPKSESGISTSIKGIKTLFPESWTASDYVNAAEHLLSFRNASSTNNLITGQYNGVKLGIRIDLDTGKIKTMHPFWSQ